MLETYIAQLINIIELITTKFLALGRNTRAIFECTE